MQELVRRLSSRVAAVAVLLAAGAGPAAAAPPLTEGGTVVVPSTGETALTPFTTLTDHVYQVTVSGTYTYNGSTSLADCAYWQPEYAGGAWHAGAFLQVDGGTAGCSGQAYSDTHTYSWYQDGTGDPLSFRVVDWGGSADNYGGFAVTVVAVGDRSHTPSGDCHVLALDDTENDVKAYALVVYGEAAGVPVPLSITASCEIVGPDGRVAWVEGTAPGAVVAAADAVLLPRVAYQVCWHVHATWSGSADGYDDGCKPA